MVPAAQAAASDTDADYESDVDGQTVEQRLNMVVNMVGVYRCSLRRLLLPTAAQCPPGRLQATESCMCCEGMRAAVHSRPFV